jgi:hypothetical protein
MSMTQPAPTLDRVRLDDLTTRRDRAGVTRVYYSGTLLGSLRLVRATWEGRDATRWLITPAAAAFTELIIDAPPPPPEHREQLTPQHTRRSDALVQLVDHLHHHGAAAVAPLYGDRS